MLVVMWMRIIPASWVELERRAFFPALPFGFVLWKFWSESADQNIETNLIGMRERVCESIVHSGGVEISMVTDEAMDTE